MHGIAISLLLALAPSAHADDIDISPALVDSSKPKWDPKGKALDPFARAKTKYRNKEYEASIPGFVESVSKRPGCGECLDYLSSALYYAEMYDQAIQVGEHLEALYPDKKEGPDIIARAKAEQDEFTASNEAIERILALEDEGGSTPYWWFRTNNLISMGQMDEALELLEASKDAGLDENAASCLKIMALAVQKQAGPAREMWESCDETGNLDLKRETEGWLALAEGDAELAGKRLMLSGNEDYARLTIAFVRLDQEDYEPALNLARKFLKEKDRTDGHLALALALHGLDRDDEAIEALDKVLTADGWEKAHKAWDLTNVQLKPEGSDWPQTVGRRALALKIAILATRGDTDAAKALHDKAVAVHGEHDDLSAALEASAEDGEGDAEAEKTADK